MIFNWNWILNNLRLFVFCSITRGFLALRGRWSMWNNQTPLKVFLRVFEMKTVFTFSPWRTIYMQQFFEMICRIFIVWGINDIDEIQLSLYFDGCGRIWAFFKRKINDFFVICENFMIFDNLKRGHSYRNFIVSWIHEPRYQNILILVLTAIIWECEVDFKWLIWFTKSFWNLMDRFSFSDFLFWIKSEVQFFIWKTREQGNLTFSVIFRIVILSS